MFIIITSNILGFLVGIQSQKNHIEYYWTFLQIRSGFDYTSIYESGKMKVKCQMQRGS